MRKKRVYRDKESPLNVVEEILEIYYWFIDTAFDVKKVFQLHVDKSEFNNNN